MEKHNPESELKRLPEQMYPNLKIYSIFIFSNAVQ